MKSLPSWPPQMSAEDQDRLTELAVDYALSHSLVLRPPAPANDQGAGPSKASVIHAPITLMPTPFPQDCFDLARRLQPAYNALYAHVASDPAFLHRIIGTSVSLVDSFTGSLYSVYRRLEAEPSTQKWQLGLFRSDYLLHEEEDGSGLGIRQVEFNTISSSFGPLASKTADMHRYLADMFAYPRHPDVTKATYPRSFALYKLAAGLASGHQAYLSSLSSPPDPDENDPVILMAIQPSERNAFDQLLLQYQLLEFHQIRMLRIPFPDLHSRLSLSDGPERRLLLDDPRQPADQPIRFPLSVSVVYYRAGYTPDDYPSQMFWDTRLLIERSHAIKCPSVALQLSGAKKVQQVLSDPNELEAFLGRGERTLLADETKTRLTEQDVSDLRKGWTEMYPLDESERGKRGYKLATDPSTAKDYVLKPQREGGGNNIYGSKIPPALAEMERRDAEKTEGGPKEREGYILMSMIRPPKNLENVLLRSVDGATQAIKGEVVSELGIYGIVVFREGEKGSGAEVMVNDGEAGFLLRTKASVAEEGGVAVGISCLDTPLLLE